MARMKDIKDKFNTIKDKFKTDKSDDQSLRLGYDTNLPLNNIAATKELCAELRRIGSYGIVTYSISEDDKKMKKKSLNTLKTLFFDTSTKFQESDPMRGPLNYSALILSKINDITKEFEKNLQHQVIEPLARVEVDCAEIQELRKKLHDLKRESVTLNDRLGRMLDQSNPDEQKCNSLKEQIEEVKMEFENISDLYIQKVLQFEASNFEHAQSIHEMVLIRAEYHDKCAKELLKIIPEANQFMEERRTPFSFAYPLENHLREIKKCIAYPIEKCCTALSNEDDLREEGLFRVSGVKSKSNLLCNALNIMKFEKISYKWPPHVVADALKRYLRELPVPLMGKVTSSEWDQCYDIYKSGSKQNSYNQIKHLIDTMPKSYFNNIEYVIRFLNKVVQQKSYNLMNIQNICTVFSPNLFKMSTGAITDIGMNIEMTGSHNFVLEALLTDTEFFFPGGNQDSVTPLQKSKKRPANRLKLKEIDVKEESIKYRTNSDNNNDNDLELSLEGQRQNEKSNRRRQRCLDSNILISRDNVSSPISSQSSITSISSELNSNESPVPVPPPRKNKNY